MNTCVGMDATNVPHLAVAGRRAQTSGWSFSFTFNELHNVSCQEQSKSYFCSSDDENKGLFMHYIIY